MTAQAGLDSTTLVRRLHEIGVVKTGDFVLKDGRHSPIYCDLRVLIGHPDVMRLVGDAMLQKASEIEHDVVAGIPYAGLPLACTMSILGDVPLVFPRKEAKDYGTKKRVEGVFETGARALVIDDVITTGGAKIEAVVPLREAGLTVRDILVVVDREQAPLADLADAGLQLHSVFKLSAILDELDNGKLISADDAARAREFLRSG